MPDRRRTLPSVDRLLRAHALEELLALHPRELVVRAVREALAGARSAGAAAPADEDAWARRVGEVLARAATPTLRRCVNATGVVLHTNLGRAPLARAAIEAMTAAAAGYTTLEYDVASGTRGSRQVHCAALLTELTGAADALVVNNAASALVLALATAAAGGEVVVSRGELIEIGGGFRIPEIMETSGCRLREVGTTNRTRVADYEKALRPVSGVRGQGSRAAIRAILKVHRSNFKQVGFVEEATLVELVALGRRKKRPVIYDLGGGLMADLAEAALVGEPTLPQAARSGAQAVIASGDKLLGGPQAGILVGTRRFVAACRTHPFARAARADKLTLAALAATLTLYRDPALARREVPVLRMLTESVPVLEARARALAARLPSAAQAEVALTRAAVGGGAFPGVVLESRGVALRPAGVPPDVLAARLRQRPVPVIAVVNAGRVVLDVRTLLPDDDDHVLHAVADALA
jgi:L-seryl-tRNA(Ser) seleniumtransferase